MSGEALELANGAPEKRTLRAVSRLTHVDDPERVEPYRSLLRAERPCHEHAPAERERRLLTMLA